MPAVTTACLMTPIGVLQGIYAKYFGLSLTAIATVVLFSRLFDAITDPLVGYYADRCYQRTGTYKPFILAGGLLFIISSYYLYTPPQGVSIIYFTGWFFLFYLAWTMFEMPHLAWGSELTHSSEEKTRIFSFRNGASYVGWIIFYIIPLLPIFDSHAVTPKILNVTVIVGGILMLPFLWFFIKTEFNVNYKLDSSNDLPTSLKKNSLAQRQGLYQFSLNVIKNKPLLNYLIAFFLLYMASGMWYSLIFLYVDAYLGLGEQYAKIFLLAFIISVAATPLWYKLAVRWGKRNVWAISTVLTTGSFIYTGFLSPESGGFTELFLLKTIQTLGFSCTAMIAPAMLSEIIDYSQWKYRTDKSATYFSIHAFMTKSAGAVATALGLAIAGLYGFDATLISHSAESVFGMKLAISWLPPVFSGLALVFICLSPITEYRHRIIRCRLDARVSRSRRDTDTNEVSMFVP